MSRDKHAIASRMQLFLKLGEKAARRMDDDQPVFCASVNLYTDSASHKPGHN